MAFLKNPLMEKVTQEKQNIYILSHYLFSLDAFMPTVLKGKSRLSYRNAHLVSL